MRTTKQPKVRKRPSAKQVAATRRKLGLLTLDQRLRAIQGKYAWIPFSSDDLIAEKHRAIEEPGMPVARTTNSSAKRGRRRPVGRLRKMRLMTHAERVEALCGKFASVPTSSDEFIARKAAEKEREDRRCRPS